MCGAYGFGGFSGFQVSINLLLRFQLENKIDANELLNIRPTMKSVVVTRNSPNKGQFLQFGIKAPWNEEMLLINAKSETVSELKTYKKMFEDTRCLIPASYFFEWKKNDDGTKTPYLFKLKNENMFAFAGIYSKEGFVILTTKPNKLVEKIHNRMPVILKKDIEDVWLNPKSTESDLTDCMTSYEESEMEYWPVSNLVNNASNKSPEIIKPLKIN